MKNSFCKISASRKLRDVWGSVAFIFQLDSDVLWHNFMADSIAFENSQNISSFVFLNIHCNGNIIMPNSPTSEKRCKNKRWVGTMNQAVHSLTKQPEVF